MICSLCVIDFVCLTHKMTSSSSSSIILCLFVLVCPFVISVDICKEKDRANYSLTLKGALTFSKYLLLFDEDWRVYEVPYRNLENSYGQLLMNIKGKPLTEYWPLFASNRHWPKIAPTIIEIYHVEKVKAYVYFVAPNYQKGVCYNVQDSEWCGQLNYNAPKGSDDVMVTDTWQHQYSFQWTGGVIQVSRWPTIWDERTEVIQSQEEKTIGFLYYTVDPDTKARNLTLINGLYPTGSKENPCADNPGFERYKLEQLDWGEQGYLPKGFVYKNYFYIYAQKNVFLVEDTIRQVPQEEQDYGKILASAPVKTVTVKDYFKCRTEDLHNYTFPPPLAGDSQDEVKQWNTNGGGGIPWWVWLVIGIAIIGALVAILLVFVFARKNKNLTKRKHKSRHTHGQSLHTKKGTSKGSRKKSHRSVRGGSTAEQVSKGGSIKQQASAKGVASNHRSGASKRETARSAGRGGST